MKTMTMTAAAALLATGGAAFADGHGGCGIESGSVRILSNDFPALQAVNAEAAECVTDGVTVEANMTTEHRNIQVAALTTDPATYTVAVVATSSIVPLMNEDLIRPLDDLVAQYGQDLQPSQLIRVGDNIMAIAFMANAQHLIYREDILAENGIDVPGTYEELVAAGEKLRAAGISAPLASAYMPGWNVAAEFINTYLSTGAPMFQDGSAELAIDGSEGVAVLEAMKATADLMAPEYITYDSNELETLWESGDTAIAISWGSRAGGYIAEDSPVPDIASNTAFAAAPALGDSTVPGAALWWDGFTIAKNISDEDAEASFRAMVHGISPEMMAENLDKAVWLIEGYEPTDAAAGVVANLAAGAKPYPMLPYVGLLHTALGDNLSDYLQGNESAEQALADVKAAYTTAAREGGFLN